MLCNLGIFMATGLPDWSSIGFGTTSETGCMKSEAEIVSMTPAADGCTNLEAETASTILPETGCTKYEVTEYTTPPVTGLATKADAAVSKETGQIT